MFYCWHAASAAQCISTNFVLDLRPRMVLFTTRHVHTFIVLFHGGSKSNHYISRYKRPTTTVDPLKTRSTTHWDFRGRITAPSPLTQRKKITLSSGTTSVNPSHSSRTTPTPRMPQALVALCTSWGTTRCIMGTCSLVFAADMWATVFEKNALDPKLGEYCCICWLLFQGVLRSQWARCYRITDVYCVSNSNIISEFCREIVPRHDPAPGVE